MADGLDRRGFFKLVGLSSAAAAAAGCGKTTETLLPFVIPPSHLVPGVATSFATVCRECPAGCGALARNRDGHVVKLEGNPDHPVSRGALCARGQASLLGTYDPDRVPTPRLREGQSWKALGVAEAEKLLGEKLAAARQAGAGRIAFVSQLETGTLGRLMDEWLKAIGGRPRVAFEPFAYEALRTASRLTFGIDGIPYHAFEDARSVLSLGADYLETWISPVGYAGGFRRMHAVAEGVGGVVFHVEPRYSMTAANADEWLANAPGTESLVALAILRILLEEGLVPTLSAKDATALLDVARGVEVEAAARQSGIPAARLKHVAETLAKAAPSLVVTGGVAVTGPGATDAAVATNLLNYALGNVGKTVRYGPNSAFGQASRYAELAGLIRAMAAGEIAVLLIKDANPAFTLPPASGFAQALAKVPFVVSLSSHLDETAAQAHLQLPDLTPLESWGDYSPREGVWGLIQPAMGPVPSIGPRREDVIDLVFKRPGETFPGVQTKATGDLLLDLGRALVPGSEKGPWQAKTFADYLRVAWSAIGKTAAAGVPFDTFWETALRQGGVWAEVPATKVALQAGIKVGGQTAALTGGDGPVLLLVPSSRYYDGRSANKPWLHETPDPMIQVVYDSWVEVPAASAARLGVSDGDVVRLSSPHGRVELSVVVSETLHPGAVAVPLGLGHSHYGRFAQAVGQSPLPLLPGEPDPVSGGLRWLAGRVTLERTGRRDVLATPAGTTEVDHEREIVETVAFSEATAAEKPGGAAPAHANLPSMYPDLKYPEHRWGMTIDLDACTGCQACVVACVAENNVPIMGLAEVPRAPVLRAGPFFALGEQPNPFAYLGKWQIGYGRSIHWLRVERWWDKGHPEPGGQPAPGRARFMPMLCQHCEVAPCEPVCPVFAAYHTAEGLNGQVYNRCVGTRYCANNCPYIVRRFNWYRFQWPGPLTLALNPDVAVRDRGVMEKCTMCVQRIIAGKDRAKDEKRQPRDGEIMTACQQTCPTKAIVFGDLKDGQSRASKLSASPRGYHALGELGTRPAVTYLKKAVKESHG